MELYLSQSIKRARKDKLAIVSPRITKKMDVLWEELPEDVLEIVMAWLPIKSMFDFRLVSHRWNSLFATPYFRKHWDEVATRKEPCFFLKESGNSVVSFYDPSMQKWHNTEHIDLPTSVTLTSCSSQGLVCFIDAHKLYIGNPMIQTWREIPCTSSGLIHMQLLGYLCLGMVSIPDQQLENLAWKTKIFILHKHGMFKLFTIMKDSTSKPTMTIWPVPGHIRVPVFMNSHALSIGTILYITCTFPLGIITYNTVTENWTQHYFKKPENSDDYAFVESNGKFWLMGTTKKPGEPSLSVCIWELETTMRWKEIDKMPAKLCVEFVGKQQVGFECLCNRRVVWFSLKTSRMNRLFTYDLVTKKWLKIPKPRIPGQKRQTIVDGVGIFPSFCTP